MSINPTLEQEEKRFPLSKTINTFLITVKEREFINNLFDRWSLYYTLNAIDLFGIEIFDALEKLFGKEKNTLKNDFCYFFLVTQKSLLIFNSVSDLQTLFSSLKSSPLPTLDTTEKIWKQYETKLAKEFDNTKPSKERQKKIKRLNDAMSFFVKILTDKEHRHIILIKNTLENSISGSEKLNKEDPQQVLTDLQKLIRFYYIVYDEVWGKKKTMTQRMVTLKTKNAIKELWEKIENLTTESPYQDFLKVSYHLIHYNFEPLAIAQTRQEFTIYKINTFFSSCIITCLFGDIRTVLEYRVLTKLFPSHTPSDFLMNIILTCIRNFFAHSLENPDCEDKEKKEAIVAKIDNNALSPEELKQEEKKTTRNYKHPLLKSIPPKVTQDCNQDPRIPNYEQIEHYIDFKKIEKISNDIIQAFTDFLLENQKIIMQIVDEKNIPTCKSWLDLNKKIQTEFKKFVPLLERENQEQLVSFEKLLETIPQEKVLNLKKHFLKKRLDATLPFLEIAAIYTSSEYILAKPEETNQPIFMKEFLIDIFNPETAIDEILNKILLKSMCKPQGKMANKKQKINTIPEKAKTSQKIPKTKKTIQHPLEHLERKTRKFIQTLNELGFSIKHITGSHYHFFHPKDPRNQLITVPNHGGRQDLSKGLFQKIKSLLSDTLSRTT